MFIENFKIALKALWANRMRSVLTTLGIIIGVASVIAVVSLVQGLEHGLATQLQGVGATYVQVVPDAGEDFSYNRKYPRLTYEDGLAVMKASSEIRQFTPVFFTNAQSKYLDRRHELFLLGVSESYQDVVNHWVEKGRFFTPLDVEGKKRVCTIGIEAARKLGLGGQPIGKVLDLNGTSFTVIGVMEKKGRMFGQDRDDLILIPFPTAAILYGTYGVERLQLEFQARDAKTMDLAKEQISETLRRQHRLKKDAPDDFRILLQEEILKTVSKALLSTSLVMGAVVGIALLVGGIGIMNIMLVSVTERTREIGIRKSIGARRQDVLVQFLIEAVALSGIGGIVGVVTGVILAMSARAFIQRWIDFPAVHTPIWAVVLAVGFCAVLGVIFGIYPAAKASKLDPIEALRYE
ncbi:MAG TPA: ABC transporter permease [Thermoanaerobaculia bacterium]|nr:ABC transporter permease [Thermoanaerobaculia bacterium]